MKRKLLFCFLLALPFLLFAESKSFLVKTQLKTSQDHTLFFNWNQEIELSCNLTSPPLQKVTVTFRRIKAKGNYLGKTFELDTQEKDEDHFDQLSLQDWIDTPLTMDLNSRYEVSLPLKDFEHVLRTKSGVDAFFKPESLVQIVNAALCPKQFNPQKNRLTLSLFFPTNYKYTLCPNHSPQPGLTKLFFDQDVQTKKDLVIDGEKKELHLSGDLAGEIIWKPEDEFVSSYSLYQVLDEKGPNPLSSSPLQFEYSFSLEKI